MRSVSNVIYTLLLFSLTPCLAGNHYDLLGVSRSADPSVIKSAYRKMAFELHPDRTNGDLQKKALFIMVTEAYETLSEPTRRAEYDKNLGPEDFSNEDLIAMMRAELAQRKAAQYRQEQSQSCDQKLREGQGSTQDPYWRMYSEF